MHVMINLSTRYVGTNFRQCDRLKTKKNRENVEVLFMFSVFSPVEMNMSTFVDKKKINV